MKTTTPGSIGGMNVAIAWPNMWLSGSRFRNRSGKNGRAPLAVFQHLALDRNDVRQHVAVRDDDAFRLGGGARGEDDLGDVVARRWTAHGGRPSPSRPLDLVQLPDRRVDRRARTAAHPGRSARAWRRRSRRRARGNRATRGSRSGRRRCRASRQPQNATIHSGRFSLQKTTLSPLRDAERVQARREAARRARDLARRCSCGCGTRRRRRETRRARCERSPKKSMSVSRATSEL